MYILYQFRACTVVRYSDLILNRGCKRADMSGFPDSGLPERIEFNANPRSFRGGWVREKCVTIHRTTRYVCFFNCLRVIWRKRQYNGCWNLLKLDIMYTSNLFSFFSFSSPTLHWPMLSEWGE